MDLLPELAPLFRDEPPQRPVDDVVRAGRRRLRRRRLGQGLAAVVALGALGTTYAVTSGAPSTDSTLVATTTATPSADPASSPAPPEPTAQTKYDSPDTPAAEERIRGFHLDQATGEVTALAGGTVREVVPMPPEPDGLGAVGVAAVVDGEETWYYLSWAENSSASAMDPPQAGTTLADWVQAQQDLQLDGAAAAAGAPDVPDFPVTDRFGHYTAPPGTTVVRRVDNPLGLPAPYTSVGLVLREDGTDRAYLLTPDGGTGGTSIDKLVARQQKGGFFSQSGPHPPLTKVGDDGMPVVMPGVEVVRTIDDAIGTSPPRRSVAYVLRFEGRTWWYLWELGPSGYQGAETTRVAGDGYPDVDAWLADQEVRTQW